MVDSHCHIAGEEFAGDLPAVIDRARAAGVSSALVILAADSDEEIAQWSRVHELWPETRAAVGVHPHHAHLFAADPDEAARLVERRLASLPEARAVGEIGLDYHYDFSPREVQQAVFRAQLRVARERNLPVVIHTREAEDDTLRILGESGRVETAGVFHCFSGDTAAATRALATGYYLSIPGIVVVSEGGGAAGGRRRRAARPAAGRDRQPLSGAGAVSRKAERAGLRGPGGGRGGRSPRNGSG